MAPDHQPAVRSAGAAQEPGVERRGLAARAGRSSAHFSTQSPTRTGERAAPTRLENAPGRGTTAGRTGGEGTGRMLDSPPTGQQNALPSEGDRRPTSGGASTRPEKYLAIIPAPVTPFQHARRNPFCDPRRRLSGKATSSNGTNETKQRPSC